MGLDGNLDAVAAAIWPSGGIAAVSALRDEVRLLKPLVDAALEFALLDEGAPEGTDAMSLDVLASPTSSSSGSAAFGSAAAAQVVAVPAAVAAAPAAAAGAPVAATVESLQAHDAIVRAGLGGERPFAARASSLVFAGSGGLRKVEGLLFDGSFVQLKTTMDGIRMTVGAAYDLEDNTPLQLLQSATPMPEPPVVGLDLERLQRIEALVASSAACAAVTPAMAGAVPVDPTSIGQLSAMLTQAASSRPGGLTAADVAARMALVLVMYRLGVKYSAHEFEGLFRRHLVLVSEGFPTAERDADGRFDPLLAANGVALAGSMAFGCTASAALHATLGPCGFGVCRVDVAPEPNSADRWLGRVDVKCARLSGLVARLLLKAAPIVHVVRGSMAGDAFSRARSQGTFGDEVGDVLGLGRSASQLPRACLVSCGARQPVSVLLRTPHPQACMPQYGEDGMRASAALDFVTALLVKGVGARTPVPCLVLAHFFFQRRLTPFQIGDETFLSMLLRLPRELALDAAGVEAAWRKGAASGLALQQLAARGVGLEHGRASGQSPLKLLHSLIVSRAEARSLAARLALGQVAAARGADPAALEAAMKAAFGRVMVELVAATAGGGVGSGGGGGGGHASYRARRGAAEQAAADAAASQ